jgi:hypothetical protein
VSSNPSRACRQGGIVLENFEIQGFRAFSRLQVGRFGRVNLVVGRNNVGKTMLLEALRVYALGGNPVALRNLLLERDEVTSDVAAAEPEARDFHLRFESLFHRPAPGASPTREIQLGPLNDDASRVRIQATMLRRVQRDLMGSFSYEPIEGEASKEPNALSGLMVGQGRAMTVVPVHDLDNRHRPFRLPSSGWPAFVPARGVSDRDMARWWDSIALRDAEARVVECLRIIAPVERINLVEHPIRGSERLAIVKMAGDPVPVPLKSLGDGMARIFQIALALECSRAQQPNRGREEPSLFPEPVPASFQENSILLIDEIENGIHYTALPELWSFIIRIAKMHNVQVFAATHSWDCILGLRSAAERNPDAQVMLVRLERAKQVTKAVLFDRDELAIVARDEIEVR